MLDSSELKIAIVDGDVKYANTVKKFIKDKFDAEVTVSENASDFLFYLEKTPDMVIMEYSLPDLRGDKLLKSIHEYDKKINVVILSNQTDSKVARHLIEQDIYEYIVKTNNSFNVLEATIVQLLEEKMKFKLMMDKAYAQRNKLFNTFKGLVFGKAFSKFKVKE